MTHYHWEPTRRSRFGFFPEVLLMHLPPRACAAIRGITGEAHDPGGCPANRRETAGPAPGFQRVFLSSFFLRRVCGSALPPLLPP
jgi:hypothetical protein